MSTPHLSLGVFLLTWGAVAFGLGAFLSQMKAPYAKLLLIRMGSILGAALLLLGVWHFSETSKGLFFGICGLTSVLALNFYCVRVCPHCARTAWPRYELSLGLCPRCGLDLSRPHDRLATWRRYFLTCVRANAP